MEKMSFSGGTCGTGWKFAILLLVLSAVSSTAFGMQEVSPEQTEIEKKQVIYQVAQNWVQVGTRQYERSYYEAAKRSFLKAAEYKEFLSAKEWKQLNGLLEQTYQATLEKERLLKHIQIANGLLEQGLFINAKAHLEKIHSSDFFTEEEHAQIAESISRLENELEEQKNEISERYNKSVEFYNAGQLERARAGFIAVAENGLFEVSSGLRPEEYIARIDNVLGRSVNPVLPTAEIESLEKSGLSEPEDTVDLFDIWAEPKQSEHDKPVKLNDSEVIAIAEPVTEQQVSVLAETSFDTDRRSLRQSYAVAVVKDAVLKARIYVDEGKYYQAKEAVKTARQAIDENRNYLGENLFKEYNLKLRQISSQIHDGRTKWLGSWDSKVERKIDAGVKS